MVDVTRQVILQTMALNTVLDTDTNKIIDFSIMHIGSVALGNAMHKQGLINCIESLESRGVNIKC